MDGDPSLLEKAGRSRICLSVDGKHLKADCGFGLDDSKKLHFCSDAQMPRSVKTALSVLTEYGPRFAGPNRLTVPHSHSIVAGGLEEMS